MEFNCLGNEMEIPHKNRIPRMEQSFKILIVALLFLDAMNGQIASRISTKSTVANPMLTNSGFEGDSLAPWIVTAGTVSLSATARTGVHGLMMQGHDTQATVFQDIEGLIVGRTYEISAWVMSSGGATNGVILWAHDTQGNGVVFNRMFPGKTWHHVSLLFAPTATGKLRVHLIQVAGSSAITYWDDISVISFTGTGNPGINEASSILLRTILHFVLALLPCLAICTYAVRRGVRDELLLGLVGLAGLGVVGYVLVLVCCPDAGSSL
jgi:hypothetical protein